MEGRFEFELFELLGQRPSISYCFIFRLRVRRIHISKWPQSLINSDHSSDGDAAILPLGNGGICRAVSRCAARAMWELGRYGRA